jgi:hypothetical protein
MPATRSMSTKPFHCCSVHPFGQPPPAPRHWHIGHSPNCFLCIHGLPSGRTTPSHFSLSYAAAHTMIGPVARCDRPKTGQRSCLFIPCLDRHGTSRQLRQPRGKAGDRPRRIWGRYRILSLRASGCVPASSTGCCFAPGCFGTTRRPPALLHGATDDTMEVPPSAAIRNRRREQASPEAAHPTVSATSLATWLAAHLAGVTPSVVASSTRQLQHKACRNSSGRDNEI